MFSTCRNVLALVACVFASQSGCTSVSEFARKNTDDELDVSMLSQQGFDIPPGGMPTGVNPSQLVTGPSIVLEVRNGSRHLESIPMPTDRPVFIEDIVQQAKLAKRLGRLNVSIMRANGPVAPPIRLTTDIESNGRASSLGTNYALKPGDHIVVNLDNTSALEEFLKKNLGIEI